MRCILLPAIAALSLVIVTPAAAEMFGPEFGTCGDQPTTLATVECLDAKTKLSDRRLNTAYKALQQRIEPAQRQPLLTAQRLWIQYRDANRGFYHAQEGPIRRIVDAHCLRRLPAGRRRDTDQALTY